MDDGLQYFHLVEDQTVSTNIDAGQNEGANLTADPALRFFDNDQSHWIAYLSGQIAERYDSAWLALQTMLVSEGIFLSSELEREVTAQEIEALSQSNAVGKQQTPWGAFEYRL